MNTVRAIDIRLLGKQRTGDETVFFNLTKELLGIDKEHTYLLLTDEREPQAIKFLQARLGCIGQSNVRIVSLRGKNRFVWNFVTLPWYLFTHHIDVFHTQYILPLFVPNRTKVVDHIHDVSFAAYPELVGWRDRLFLSLLIPRSVQRANRLIAPSQFTKQELHERYHVPVDKISVVTNALSEDFLALHQEGMTAQLKEKYLLPERYIAYVGTLQPRKNIPFLLQAFALLRKRIPDIHLVLVGKRFGHHYDQAIEQILEEYQLQEWVHFPGYVDQGDLPGLVHAASLFVFPSLYEGFGIPLLEAMSQEVPVVASDIPCLREIGGEAVTYFDISSLASCEEKLYTLLTDMNQRENGVSLGRSRVSLFSWKKSAVKLLSVYDSVK